MTLLFDLIRLRRAGRMLPRHQHALDPRPTGCLRIGEQYRPDLHRHSLVAALVHPTTGAPIPGVTELVDVRILRWSGDLVVLTGTENVEDQAQMATLECAQTWLLSAICE